MEYSDRGLKLALYALGRRMMSASELRDYLLKKEIPQNEINPILRKLRELNYLDDEAFAENFARVQIARGGRRKIAWELKKKGVDPDTIRATVEAVDPDEEFAAAMRFASRALRGETDYKAKNRAYAALYRRGYVGDVVRKAVEAALDEAREADEMENMEDMDENEF